MSKQSDLQGEFWLTLQKQPLSLTFPYLMEMTDGYFPEHSSALSNLPSPPQFLWYFKAKFSTLNVPIHPPLPSDISKLLNFVKVFYVISRQTCLQRWEYHFIFYLISLSYHP